MSDIAFTVPKEVVKISWEVVKTTDKVLAYTGVHDVTVLMPAPTSGLKSMMAYDIGQTVMREPPPPLAPRIVGADYLEKALCPRRRREIVRKAVRDLQGLEFDTIVCTGVSGALYATALAYEIDRPLTVIRKDAPDYKNRHSSHWVEGLVDFGSFLFVDDLVSSGATFRRCAMAVAFCAPRARCVGVYQMSNRHASLSGSSYVLDDACDTAGRPLLDRLDGRMEKDELYQALRKGMVQDFGEPRR